MSRDRKNAATDVAKDVAAFYGRILELLDDGRRGALCTILRLEGSGPRRAGAKMLVCEAGGSCGTVGGGVLEMKAIMWARESVQSGRALCRTVALDLQQASEDGMTCGGEVELLVEPLDATTSEVRACFASVVDLLRRGERGWLVTALSEDNRGIASERFLVSGGRVLASTSPSHRGLPKDLLRTTLPTTPTVVEQESVRYFFDPLAPPTAVYVFGGGHIGMHLVALCHLLGFRTVVADDRADFVSEDRFPDADQRLAVPSVENALESIPVGEESCIVIVTRGHGGDQAILRQALRRRPGYIGMIGSSRKRALIFDQLLAEGFTQADLDRVTCPIGLPVGAETPEEIAVSIAAQLVAVRAAQRGEG